MSQNKKILSILIVTIYLILLAPYMVASNSGEVGIVKNNQGIDVNSLPEDIQDLLIYKNSSYNLILIEDPINNIKNLKGQISKERKLVLSKETAENNNFVRVDNALINIYAPNNIISFTNQTFDRLIIGDTKKAELGGVIEIISYLGLTPILTVSQIAYFIGGILIVIILTFLFNKMLALWNIPAIITCYSFQFFLASRIASMNHLEAEFTILLFGFLFIPALLLTFKVKKLEDTNKGRQNICDLYKGNIKLFKTILLKFKNKIDI